MTTTPNIFDYATSELSQDAFICYLLSFGKKEFNGSKEYIAAHKFLRECGIEEDVKEIHTQYKHIDVLVETGNYLLIIEDIGNARDYTIHGLEHNEPAMVACWHFLISKIF